ncbi:MAG: FtsW/RodA/SpoVE family cell cycle protein, partial [Rhodobacter sp.]|nr:FtsW/RodA/SpoVE family cell cycle protein [Rhodobacter sp.]
MTEMVYGSMPARVGEPVLPRWWRTIDKWSLTCILMLFGIGLLLGLAASVPLATRNGLEPFHYVQRQVAFGGLAILAMLGTSMMSPHLVRRLAVLGFVPAFAALALLPLFGTDYGKGAVRWFSLGFGSVQPSEFLKPFFVILCAWLISASAHPNGPPGKTVSFVLAAVIMGFLAMQPDFGQAALVLFGWGVMYFVAGAPIMLIATILALTGAGAMFAYSASDHFARRIDGFLTPDIDPRTQLGYAANAIQEGGFFGVGVGEGQVKWSL